MIGTSVEIWQNLQNTCDWKLIEIELAKDIDVCIGREIYKE